LANDSDDANDVPIERRKLLRGHPQLQVLAAADLFHLELGDVFRIDIEGGP
jgi:hypothetical protein